MVGTSAVYDDGRRKARSDNVKLKELLKTIPDDEWQDIFEQVKNEYGIELGFTELVKDG